MRKRILRRMLWLGRGTATMMGLALIVAVVLGVATTALAAVPGDPLKLGRINTIDRISQLVGDANSAMLRIDNNSSGAKATALDLRVEPGKAPMRVNSNGKVANLNADMVDGKSSTDFLGTNSTAANSDKVDGKHADQLVRVASFAGRSLTGLDRANGTVATTKITAPAPGFLVIDAGSDLANRNETGYVTCRIEVNDVLARGSYRFMELNGAANVNEDEDCSTNTVVPVVTGTHTVDLEGISDGASSRWYDTALSAIYIPFDGAGASPSSGAITAAQEVTPESRK